MTDVDDPRGWHHRVDKELDRIDGLEDERDADALRRWADRFDCAPATAEGRLVNVRKLSERADGSLVDFESADDFYALHGRLKSGEHPDVPDDGLADSTLRNVRKCARVFFDFLGREWADDIHVGSGQDSTVGADDVLVDEEIDALVDVGTARDRALVAFLVVTGQRISAALSITLADTDVDHDGGRVRLNSEATGLKGASGPRPLLWSAGYISRWLDDHPRRGDPDAPLFCTTQGGVIFGKRYDKGDALTPEGVRTRLRELADRAGVPTEKVNPHNFRHTAITRMMRQGIPEPRIKFMVGVDQDSTILSRYTHVRDEEMVDGLRESFGVEADEETPDVGTPTLDDCTRCGAVLADGARFCSNCGLPLTDDAQDVRRSARDAGLADIVDADEETKRRLFAEFVEFADERPDLFD